MNTTKPNSPNLLIIGWAFYGVSLLLAAALAIPLSAFFGYDTRVVDMPLLELFLAFILVTGPFVALPLLINRTLASFASMKNRLQAKNYVKFLFAFMLVIGFVARLLMLFSDPLMEDDYQRYMWDGALVANGHNPYQFSPKDIFEGVISGQPHLERLGTQSGPVLERINHPSLRTIYPPVAQLGFALAYWLEPFSLTAWRGVALVCELISLGLLLVLLRALNRPDLWVVLYWLNPLVIKELINSGHMEVMLVPMLLGALWATIVQRPKLTALLLALAVGLKIWPALLVPLYFRTTLATPRKLIMPAMIFVGLIALMAWPVLITGLDQGSGFVAYAQNWKTNSALFPALEAVVRHLLQFFLAGEPLDRLAALFARGGIALALGGIALFIAWRPPAGGYDLARKTLLLTATMFLLSPAQLPWYALWFMPFMVLYPLYGLALLVPALQFYYLSFYFAVEGQTAFFADRIVWLFWIPVWTLLAFELSKKGPDGHRRLRTILRGKAP